MNIFIFYFLALFWHIHSLIASQAIHPRWIAKRDNESNSTPVYVIHKREAKRSVSTESKACSQSRDTDSGSGKRKRSIRYSLSEFATTEATTFDLSIYSDEFKNCTHITFEPECYEKLPNGSVYLPLYKAVFNRSDYVINDAQELFLCSDFLEKITDIEKFSAHTSTVSLIGTLVSSTCIIIHIIMFVLVKELRNLPGYCLLSLCAALLIAYIFTFTQIFVTEGCTVHGMLLMFFFLASFFWMNTLAYDVWKSIRLATVKLRLVTNRPIMVQFARYCFYAWGTPLMIVIIGIITHFSTPESSKFKLIFHVSNCWFQYKQALTLYFAGPVCILVAVNFIFFIHSFTMVSISAMDKSQTNSQGRSDLRSRLLLCFRLGSIMGLMWIFGIIALLTEQVWIWYLHSVFTALQGVFIFCSFTVQICKKSMRKKKYSSPTQTTSQQGTSLESSK